MPEIARFFGIIIRMFAEPAAPHHRPHLHAYYQDDVAIFAIDSVELIGGGLPPRPRRPGAAWGGGYHPEHAAARGAVPTRRPPCKNEAPSSEAGGGRDP